MKQLNNDIRAGVRKIDDQSENFQEKVQNKPFLHLDMSHTNKYEIFILRDGALKFGLP